MSSVYLVRDGAGIGGSEVYQTRGSAELDARRKGGTVVEFVPRADVQELVTALRELHDFAQPLSHYRHDARSRQAFEAAAKLLKKWEAPA